MKISEKKEEVLRVLREEIAPISLNELCEKLKGTFHERSVRRWLCELISDGLVEKVGLKRATKYCLCKEYKKLGDWKNFFRPESIRALEYVKRPLYERDPSSYNRDWVDGYIPNSTFYMPIDIREKLQEAGKRSTNKDLAGTYAHHILNRLLIDLSYNSSRLEGNTYSFLDTERLILSGKPSEGKLDEEKIMILNHKEAIRYLVEQAPRLEVSPQTIYTVHYLLSEGLVEAKYAGRVRDHSVRISGSAYVPMEGVLALQAQLKIIADKARAIDDPFEQSMFLLVHLSYLQAFTDLNKRTARLSANIPLVVGNFVPLSFNDVGKDEYMSATIAIYELFDINPMIDIFVFSYLRTCALYDVTVKSFGYDEVRVRYRQERRAVLREIISKKMNVQQVKTYLENAGAAYKIPDHHRPAFNEDIMEDLELMDQSRIVGMGITPEQLGEWSKIFHSS